ncbi:hypothetical protein GLOTRDRAFT_133781 [Gloeophyllum trabeum ATCC 11539]|uniref:Uncharacterized protein n=1 Tax=Gloeophyllum trabeum (strain ATCC 11539 / FP-39264 / Madison 617) TaxID=670483 RepID=S7PTM5_GLOTA|nr:uncharacterized protein GLOTRDRAFT_133781 [Gloeophyllum trabeum ATCC 11539]EPQ50677.1 hypothetical protein GLOTRDRAFT_133781 [Gloeophyllum trabeum ATCC 11539]
MSLTVVNNARLVAVEDDDGRVTVASIKTEEIADGFKPRFQILSGSASHDTSLPSPRVGPLHLIVAGPRKPQSSQDRPITLGLYMFFSRLFFHVPSVPPLVVAIRKTPLFLQPTSRRVPSCDKIWRPTIAHFSQGQTVCNVPRTYGECRNGSVGSYNLAAQDDTPLSLARRGRL